MGFPLGLPLRGQWAGTAELYCPPTPRHYRGRNQTLLPEVRGLNTFLFHHHLLQKATMGSTVVTSTSSSSAASAPATPGQLWVSESHTSREEPRKIVEQYHFNSKTHYKHQTELLPVCSGSLLSSSSMSNSDSLSSYSTFSSSSLKSGAKALQFSWRQIIRFSWKLAERMAMKRLLGENTSSLRDRSTSQMHAMRNNIHRVVLWLKSLSKNINRPNF